LRIAIIPARGGSQRIPRKNIRPFAGRPIIAYSIDAARNSALFDRIVVSTDDSEIAEVARAAGAEVPFMRPKELADDRTGVAEVIKHALEWFAARGQRFDAACLIYPTAPFLTGGALREGLQTLEASKRSFALAVTPYAFPIQRSVKVNDEGAIEAFWPEHAFSRSQDLEPAYHDAGQFCWGRAEAFLQSITIFSIASAAVVLPRSLVQDIDTPDDWHNAEIAYETLQRRGKLAD
jgi:N-acylneuraminate cytidylyltransferase